MSNVLHSRNVRNKIRSFRKKWPNTRLAAGDLFIIQPTLEKKYLKVFIQRYDHSLSLSKTGELSFSVALLITGKGVLSNTEDGA